MTSKLLPHLDTFLHAAELASFTAAASLLGVTQAAVSQRIQSLEQELGVSLFQRQAGRVFLTEVGRTLHGYAQQILSLNEEARASVTGREAILAGELQLAASSVPGDHLLPEILGRFGQSYPNIQVRVSVADSRLVLQQVEQGQAQLGLVGIREEHPHLEYLPLGSDELVLIVSTSHPWKRKKTITLAELREQPLILREPGSGSRQCLEQALTGAGLSLRDFTIALEMGSNEAIKSSVQRGLGAAFLSSQVLHHEAPERLHPVRVSDLPLKRTLNIVRDRRRVLTIPAQLFLAFVLPGHQQHPTPEAS